MTNLPSAYTWLSHEPGPRMLLEAVKLYGVIEDLRPTHRVKGVTIHGHFVK